MDDKAWKEERFKNMDAALTEIESAARAFTELEEIADTLDGIGEDISPDWMGYILRTIATRCRELSCTGIEIEELVNKGLTVPDPKEDVFKELAKMEPTGRQLTEMLTGKAGRTEK